MAAAEFQFMSLTEAALSESENNCMPMANVARKNSSSTSKRGADESQVNNSLLVNQEPSPESNTARHGQKSWLSHRDGAPTHDSLLSYEDDAPKRRNWPSDRDGAVKHKGWLSFPKRSSASRKSSKSLGTAKPKGTVLNLVPPALTINMTLLEEEMATSPNEEILSAVSGSPISPGSSLRCSWNAANLSLTQRTKSVVRKEKNARIGRWVNGVVELDEEYLDHHLGGEGPGPLAGAGCASTPTPVTGKSCRPLLSVVIPGKDLGIIDWNAAKIQQPVPKRSASVTPPGIVSKYDLSSGTRRTLSHIVSPLDASPATVRSIHPPERPKAPLQMETVEENIESDEQHDTSSPSTYFERASSRYSQGSSNTSVDITVEERKAADEVKTPQFALSENLNKPLPPVPSLLTTTPRCSATSAMKSQPTNNNQPTISSRSTPNLREVPTRTFPSGSKSPQSLNDLDLANQGLQEPTAAGPESPTLSEAAEALDRRLSQLFGANARTLSRIIDEVPETTDPSLQEGFMLRNSVISVMQPPQRAPTLPRRSRRRDWCMTKSSAESRGSIAAPALTRRKSDGEMFHRGTMQGVNQGPLRRTNSHTEPHSSTCDSYAASISDETCVPRIVIDDGLIVVEVSDDMHDRKDEHALEAAHEALVNILRTLPTLRDLQNTAQINKGMYLVYKEHEMHLLQTVLMNQSPAAWELREWLSSTHSNSSGISSTSSQLEYTPRSYFNCYRRDLEVMSSIKILIMKHCSSLVRAETAAGLSGDAQRYEDAIWRIWSFCQIFGCGKGREDDVTGQLDWLNGGILANNQDFTATANVNLNFDDIGSILLNPPEHFARGNGNGLNADQLYDMMEIWICLTTILQGYAGRTDQAAEYGLFEDSNFEGHTEEQLIEEWIAHIMTLGPAAILKMAHYAQDQSGLGFALARENGWTDWSLTQQGTSRTTFLKEPVSRLYEARVAAARLYPQHAQRKELKEVSRKRVANMAAEIKIARRASTFKRLPVIDMNNERPWSVVTRQNSVASVRVPPSPCLSTISRSASTINPSQPGEISSPVSAITRSSSTATFVSESKTPTCSPRYQHLQPSGHHVMDPVVEEVDEEDERLALQNATQGMTSKQAIKLIVEMGFTPARAREALKSTDVGIGLSVDRAVEFLLRLEN